MSDERRVSLDNFAAVTGKIADGGIELGEADTHERFSSEKREGVSPR
jgi:hypothetical protein